MDEKDLKLHIVIAQLKIQKKYFENMEQTLLVRSYVHYYDKWIEFFKEGLVDFVGWFEKCLCDIEFFNSGGFW